MFCCIRGNPRVSPDDSGNEWKEKVRLFEDTIARKTSELEELRVLYKSLNERYQLTLESERAKVKNLEHSSANFANKQDLGRTTAVELTHNVASVPMTSIPDTNGILQNAITAGSKSEHTGENTTRYDEVADDLEVLRSQFNAIDIDHDGFITKTELCEALEQDQSLAQILQNVAFCFKLNRDQFKSAVWGMQPESLKSFGDLTKEEAVRSLFDSLDRNSDGHVSQDELDFGIKHYRANDDKKLLAEELSKIKFSDFGIIDFQSFQEGLSRFPRPRGIRVAWAKGLQLAEAFARHLRCGDLFDGFKGIKEMTHQDLVQAMSNFCSDLPKLVFDAHESLRSPAAVSSSVSEANSKFSMEAGAFEGKFAPLELYYKGSEALVGVPNPNLDEGVRKEHTLRADADAFFVAPNYQICTCPRLEHQFAVDPDAVDVHPNVRTFLDEHDNKYPGEIGFKHRESKVTVQIHDRAGDVLITKEALLESLLRAKVLRQGSAEEARGVKILKVAGEIGNRFEIMLPIPCDRVQSSSDSLREAIGAATGASPSSVSISEPQEITFVHCRFVTGKDVKVHLERAPQDELEEWCPSAPAMSREARIDFAVSKFNDETTEWEARNQYRRQGRMRVGSNTRIMDMNLDMIKKAKLTEPEFRCLRLYTSSMYLFYNAVPRNFPKYILDKLKGNKYETTLFCVNSGLLKLSKITAVPENRLVYRGLGAMVLPSEFWIPQGDPEWRGGVEYGLMSTTTDRSVAVQYSGSGLARGIVMEISVGRIDFPGEAEFLYPMLSCLEVIGEPRIELSEGREIIVFPLKVNSNVKGLTAEELIKRRKKLHSATARNLREEVHIEATTLLDAFQAKFNDLQIVTSETARLSAMVDIICNDVAEFFRTEHDLIDPDKFNNDEEFKRLTSEAVDAKILSIMKLRLFLEVLQDRSLAAPIKESQLQRIQCMHFKKFGDRSVKLQIRSGVDDFPWGDLLDKKAILDLGAWTPSALSSDQRENLITEISCYHINGISSNGFVLDFKYNDERDTANLAQQSALKCIGHQAVFVLSANKQLTSLDLRGNSLGHEKWASLMESLQGAKSLSVLNGRSCTGLFGGSMDNLHLGYRDGHTFEDDPGFALSLVLWFPRSKSTLTCLNMGNNKLGVAGSLAMKGIIGSLCQLKLLDLSENEFGPEGGSCIAQELAALTLLRELNLRSQIPTDHSTNLMKQLQSMKKWMRDSQKLFDSEQLLNEPPCSCNGLDSSACVAVCTGIKSLEAVHCLNLWDNPLGENGARAVAETLSSFPLLSKLYLGSCGLGASGALAIAKAASSLPNLKEVGLGYNEVGSATLMEIGKVVHAGVASLEVLDLDGNDGDAETVKKVRATLAALKAGLLI